MEIMTRSEVANLLRMSPQALSNHVGRKNWEAVPPPIVIGGRNKWRKDQVVKWIESKSPVPPKSEHQGRGRPPKRRSAC